MAAEAPELELVGVSAGYGQATVLHEVSLTLPRGGVVALLGPNGAGKTTLLRAAAGLVPARAGAVRARGVDVTRLRPARRSRAGVCLIPEGRGVFPALGVRDNLRLQLPRGARGYAEALEVFPDLAGRLDHRAGALSGGQQQMLALARCWLARPTAVLLDEVSMGLAPRIVDTIFEALRGLATAGIALLLVEQYVDRALALADVVHVLDRGRIAYSGPAGDLDRDTVLRSYLGAGAAAHS
jgi:branched-chain amino acid transport system ATP-binding protein